MANPARKVVWYVIGAGPEDHAEMVVAESSFAQATWKEVAESVRGAASMDEGPFPSLEAAMEYLTIEGGYGVRFEEVKEVDPAWAEPLEVLFVAANDGYAEHDQGRTPDLDRLARACRDFLAAADKP